MGCSDVDISYGASNGNVVVKPIIIFKTTASPPTTVGVAAIHECLCLWCKSEAAGILVELLRLFTNLVDPASSHMLVSKIKPCMSQCKFLYGRTVNGSLKQL